jgi:phage/plasmid-associated DNA primase
MQKSETKLYEIYPIKTYRAATANFIKTKQEKYTLEQLIKLLEKDKGYHMRIHQNQDYIFFGDLDNYIGSIDDFVMKLAKFLNENYGINVTIEDIFYTKNDGKEGSYHYSIPKIFCSCNKIKQILSNFENAHISIFKYKANNSQIRCIDTTIYSEHWFRMPNQCKEFNIVTIHRIITGNMIDFIVDFIPEYSCSIENNIFKNTVIVKQPVTKSKIKKEENINLVEDDDYPIINESDKIETETIEDIIDHEDDEYPFIDEPKKIKSSYVQNANSLDKSDKNTNSSTKLKIKKNAKPFNNPQETPKLIINEEFDLILQETKNYDFYSQYVKLFDNCFSPSRSDDYNDWISTGMALKNIFNNDAFELFNYFSSKSKKYSGKENTLIKFNSFNFGMDNGKKIDIIFAMAKKDNAKMYEIIMANENFLLTDTTFAKKIFELASDDFIYLNNGKEFKLYCYNGNYWEEGDILLRTFIAEKLFKYYQQLINDLYLNSPDYKKIMQRIENLQNENSMNGIIKAYKRYGTKKIDFDSTWSLFGFTNQVYDLETHEFRKYRKTDYLSITTNYDWIEPTEEEIETIEKILQQIMPVAEERSLFLSILATGLEGKCLEKFTILNGSGGNGKGWVGDLFLKALGSYGYSGNNAILFETNKTGSNPEKANMHKKRFIIFREPSEKNKFENSVIKELTGGGTFSARSHHETVTEKILQCTIICECNKKPLFSEDPTDADIRRLVDILFRAKFTDNEDLVDNVTVYKAEEKYKSYQFQDIHKRALLKVVMNAHIKHSENNYKLVIPKSVTDRTQGYLEASCDILDWFKNTYYLSDDKTSILKVKDVFELFKFSDFHDNLTSTRKNICTISFFTEYVKTNILLGKYYKDKTSKNRNFLTYWKLNEQEDEEGNKFDDNGFLINKIV